MNDILIDYVMKFGEEPMLLTTMTYESEFYQKIMKMAIDRNRPLEDDEISDLANEEIEYDLELPEESLSAGEYAQRYGKR